VTQQTSYMAFLGRRVQWTSQGAGIERLKRGLVIAARPSKSEPWQWVSPEEQKMNEATPTTEHYNGATAKRASTTARVIVRLDATSSRQLQSRYFTPHGSLLSIVDEPGSKKTLVPQ
jgi:hypothetical protein